MSICNVEAIDAHIKYYEAKLECNSKCHKRGPKLVLYLTRILQTSSKCVFCN